MRNILLAVFFGILEGVTEWLPISSTGHLILLDTLLDFSVRPVFFELFEVVIQLGAMLAVPLLFFERLNPFLRGKGRRERRDTFSLWGRVALGVLPSAFLGFFLDDFLEAHLYNALTVSLALISFGIVFLFLERGGKRGVGSDEVTCKRALFVGGFQLLSLIPGTSRSGSTILGGMLSGLSRGAAAEFSFFLGIPTMVGAALLKGGKFFLSGGVLSGEEWGLLLLGTVTAFLVSLVTIRYLISFVRRHSLAAFGVYRILLGIGVLCLIF